MSDYQLLENATVTGSMVNVSRAGVYCFETVGSHNGATVKLEKLGFDGATWFSVGADAELTDDGAVNVEIPAGQYRASVNGGTSPSGLYAGLTLMKAY